MFRPDMTRFRALMARDDRRPAGDRRGVRLEEKDDAVELFVYGAIGADAFDAMFFGDIDPGEFNRQLAEIDAANIRVRLNSPGGDFFGGMSIFNGLKRHRAEIEIVVDGLAASAASLVAMAGDRVIMGEAAFLMIHEAWSLAIGNKRVMAKAEETLAGIDDEQIGVYQRRTGLERAEITAMVEAETWLNAENAVGKGFADAAEAETEGAAEALAMLGIWDDVPAAVEARLSRVAVDASTRRLNDGEFAALRALLVQRRDGYTVAKGGRNGA